MVADSLRNRSNVSSQSNLDVWSDFVGEMVALTDEVEEPFLWHELENLTMVYEQ